ncbi:MAG: TolC family protein [Phycisphaerales bacterium]|nr:TolC family protein [Phycisphaerales bacterium]
MRWPLTILLPLFLLASCSSPLDGPDHGPYLDKGLTRIIEQELQQVEELERNATASKPSQVEEILSHRRDELDALSPVPPGADMHARLGMDLQGQESERMVIDIDRAVQAAVLNNLDLQDARLSPAIQREELIQAAAVFDIVLGAGISFGRSRTPITVVDQVTGDDRQALNVGLSRIEQFQYEVELTKQLTTGGTVTLSTNLDRQLQKNQDNLKFSPNPGVNPNLSLQLDQPILRGFGEDVNLANVYIAQKLEQSAMEGLRAQLITTVTETEVAYWNLAIAWRNLAIQEWLIEAAEELLDIIDRRRAYDANISDWAQAVATVEQRRAAIIGLQQTVKEASDQLKLLMNDPAIPLSGEEVLEPVDEMVHTPIELELRESLLVAIASRPDVRQSLYEIDIAEINEVVADNGRLPELDLQASVNTQGLGDTYNDGYSESFTGDFISYVVGLVFEYPLGNRAPEAAYRQTRLERSAAMVSYRQTLLQVILDVKTAMRQVLDNARLIPATRAARVATAESLRALEIERQTLASLTPTFLNLIFSTQAQLATARSDEFSAIVDFNIAVSRMYQSMGTTLDVNQIGIQVLDEDGDFDAKDLY